jgi:cyclopropane-fatty-acyl-phospholipid synthase
MNTAQTAIRLAERGLIPAPALRLGIRSIVRRRLRDEARHGRSVAQWLDQMRRSPIAPAADAANAQHYEMPPAFFELVLGPALKYSSAYWPEGVKTLADAERAMLDLTMTRAALADGQRILELGCGWGSLTLAMARRFPHAEIHAVSNSHRQRAFILARARAEGLHHVGVETADMNCFEAPGRFDRVVSVEMFEHMRNWQELLRRIHGWLHPAGVLFVHVFAHVRHAYPYDAAGDTDWMARHFFTGGMMPSDDLLPRAAAWFDEEAHWQVNGLHYARTAEAWHDRLVDRRARVHRVLDAEFGRDEGRRAYHRWRLFFLACAELFGYAGGTEWVVSHYRLRPRDGRAG